MESWSNIRSRRRTEEEGGVLSGVRGPDIKSKSAQVGQKRCKGSIALGSELQMEPDRCSMQRFSAHLRRAKSKAGPVPGAARRSKTSALCTPANFLRRLRRVKTGARILGILKIGRSRGCTPEQRIGIFISTGPAKLLHGRKLSCYKVILIF